MSEEVGDSAAVPMQKRSVGKVRVQGMLPFYLYGFVVFNILVFLTALEVGLE